MGKLLDESRYSTRPPEMLLTHPYRKAVSPTPATVRTRCARLSCSPPLTSTAKARTLGMYTSGDNKLGNDLLSSWEKGNIREQHAAQYGRALLAMGNNNYDLARKTLQPLLSAEPQNARYLDLATDIDLGQREPQTRLIA